MMHYQYHTLEHTYEETINDSLAEKVYELAKKYITYKTDSEGKPVLPWKAVHKNYDRIENGHKYNFYEGKYESAGSSSTSTGTSGEESNYKHYNGDFNEYLKVEYFGKDAANYTMQNVYDKMGAEAEQSVRDIILVYTLVNVFDDVDLSVTDEQVDEFKLTYLWYFYGTIMEEEDYKTALLFDNVFNHILETSEEESDDNKVKYVRLEYNFASDQEDDNKDNSDK